MTVSGIGATETNRRDNEVASPQPWSKWFWADWRSDATLRLCSLSARGLWMEMLCLMAEATPRGHLLVNGNAPTDAQLAVLAGAPSDQIADLLAELESAGVFSRTRAGVIYSRRITRDEKRAAHARKIGKSGGNPSLLSGGKKDDNPPQVNPRVNGGDNTHIPEARSQKEITDAIASDAGASGGDGDWVMRDGLTWLCAKGKTERAARGMIGRWRSQGTTDYEIRQALTEAIRCDPAEPVAYVMRLLVKPTALVRDPPATVVAPSPTEYEGSDAKLAELWNAGKRGLPQFNNPQIMARLRAKYQLADVPPAGRRTAWPTPCEQSDRNVRCRKVKNAPS